MSERGGDVFAFGEFAGDEPDAQRRHSRRESEARQLDIGPREIDRLLGLTTRKCVLRTLGGNLWRTRVNGIMRPGARKACATGGAGRDRRTEETTSELQSLMCISYAVF